LKRGFRKDTKTNCRRQISTRNKKTIGKIKGGKGSDDPKKRLRRETHIEGGIVRGGGRTKNVRTNKGGLSPNKMKVIGLQILIVYFTSQQGRSSDIKNYAGGRWTGRKWFFREKRKQRRITSRVSRRV